jgi:rhamnosyltransferase
MNVSLLIPTFNASNQWVNVLESIDNQLLKPTRKIIIDSGSTDETILLGKKFGFDVVSVDKSEFNHGGTRQQLADLVPETDICVFLTQDAILATEYSLSNLVAVFADESIAIAYGRQLPHHGAKTLEAHARMYNYPEMSQVLSLEDKNQLGFKVFFCSDSFAAYRSRALNEVGGFPLKTIIGEDAIVAAKMLKMGYKKAYVAEAAVYHSHNYSLIDEYRRYFDTRVFHEQNIWLLEEFGKPTGEGLRFIRSELLYAVKNDFKSLPKSLASIFFKWLGYNTGRFFKRIPQPILKRLSMHSFYWK